MYKNVTENDIHWTVSILSKNPEIIENRERLYSALDLPLSELQDLKTSIFLHGSGSDVFLRNTIMKWISRKGTNATFAELVEILNCENFKATADAISHRVITRNNRESTCSNNSNTFFLWFDVPPKIMMFTGRALELEELHEAVITQNTEGTVITTLSGLGGIGKTALAIEYAWKYLSTFYTDVIWLNNETTITLTDSLSRLAEELKIDMLDSRGFKLTLEKLILTMYNQFQRGNTLFIFDNVECYEDVKQYLPPITPNKLKPFVLLTSRNRSWNRRVNVIVLNVFTEAESVDFLTKYLKLETESELSIAKEIAQALNNLPLGIRQAAAYIQVQNKKRRNSMEKQLKEYLIEFDQNCKSAMTHEYWRQTDDKYEKTTFVTWNVTLEKVRKVSWIAVRIMELISYLNSDNIPIDLFYYLHKSETSKLGNFLTCFNSIINESTVDEAIQVLHSYSLININENKNTFNVHRLVQKVIKIQVESKFSFLRLKEARRLLKIPLQINSFSEFEESCLIHAKSILEHLRKSNFPPDGFHTLVTTKQNNIISEQLATIIRTGKTFGSEATFNLFYEFDKVYGLGNDSPEYLLYVEKYHGAFLDFVFNEIRKCCRIGADIQIIRQLAERVLPIFKKSLMSVELSINPKMLGSVVTDILSYQNFDHGKPKELSFEMLEIIIDIYETVIKYRRKKYFHTISVRGNIYKLLRQLKDIGKIDFIHSFVKCINDMLHDTDTTDLKHSFIDTGLAGSLILCRHVFEYQPLESELTLAELRRHEIVYERSSKTVDNVEVFNSVRGKLRCLEELDRFSDILEFISKCRTDIYTFSYSCMRFAHQIYGIAFNQNCGSLREELLKEALGMYTSALEKYADWSHYSEYSRVQNMIRCSIELNKVDVFQLFINTFSVLKITCKTIIDNTEFYIDTTRGPLESTFNSLKQKVLRNEIIIHRVITSSVVSSLEKRSSKNLSQI